MRLSEDVNVVVVDDVDGGDVGSTTISLNAFQLG